MQYTLPQRRIESVVPRTPAARLGARAGDAATGNPLGYVEFALPPGDLDADEVDRQVRAQLGPSFDRDDRATQRQLGTDERMAVRVGHRVHPQPAGRDPQPA